MNLGIFQINNIRNQSKKHHFTLGNQTVIIICLAKWSIFRSLTPLTMESTNQRVVNSNAQNQKYS